MIDLRKKFLDLGVINEKNFLSPSDKKIIKLNFNTILSHYINYKPTSFEDEKLHKKLIKMRNTNLIKFGDFYDTLNLSIGLKKLFLQDNFLKLFSKILNVHPYNLFINGFMFRLDVPNDERNNLDWHQDSPYYGMNYPEFNSGVCWVSVTENNFENGSLMYIPKSHKDGYKPTKGSKIQSYSSQQYKIKGLKNSAIETLNGKFGDLSCFSMKNIHRSGKNISKKIRMTIGCRFHEVNKKFNVGKEVYIFNKSRKITLF